MLEVTITFRHSVTGKTANIANAIIANDGTGDKSLGNYKVVLYETRGVKEIRTEGRVVDFPRLKLGPWDLLYRALRETVGEKSP